MKDQRRIDFEKWAVQHHLDIQFEKWSAGQSLDITRHPVYKNSYFSELTQIAWLAYNHALDYKEQS